MLEKETLKYQLKLLINTVATDKYKSSIIENIFNRALVIVIKSDKSFSLINRYLISHLKSLKMKFYRSILCQKTYRSI